jgi:hypothetical protein
MQISLPCGDGKHTVQKCIGGVCREALELRTPVIRQKCWGYHAIKKGILYVVWIAAMKMILKIWRRR